MPSKSPYSSQLDRIEKAIIGNGQEGLLDRTARTEERLITVTDEAEETKKAVQEAMKMIRDLTANISKLEGIVSTHIGTDHLSVLMKKKQFWIYIILGYIILHIVSTYVPNIWDLIATALGLPKLVLPLG